jgi:hypothetical protein
VRRRALNVLHVLRVRDAGQGFGGLPQSPRGDFVPGGRGKRDLDWVAFELEQTLGSVIALRSGIRGSRRAKSWQGDVGGVLRATSFSIRLSDRPRPVVWRLVRAKPV